jgi:hypothetical protein
MNLISQDKALAAGIARAHPLEGACTGRREFVISVIRNGQPITVIQPHAGRQSAMDAGLDLLGTAHGVVSVRPLVEWTEEEGAHRFPHQLHKDAFVAAWLGWHERAQADFTGEELSDAAKYKAHCDGALALQIDMPQMAGWGGV